MQKTEIDLKQNRKACRHTSGTYGGKPFTFSYRSRPALFPAPNRHDADKQPVSVPDKAPASAPETTNGTKESIRLLSFVPFQLCILSAPRP